MKVDMQIVAMSQQKKHTMLIIFVITGANFTKFVYDVAASLPLLMHAWGHSGEGSGCPCFNTFGQVTGIKKWSKDSFMLKPSHCYYGKEGQLSKK